MSKFKALKIKKLVHFQKKKKHSDTVASPDCRKVRVTETGIENQAEVRRTSKGKGETVVSSLLLCGWQRALIHLQLLESWLETPLLLHLCIISALPADSEDISGCCGTRRILPTWEGSPRSVRRRLGSGAAPGPAWVLCARGPRWASAHSLHRLCGLHCRYSVGNTCRFFAYVTPPVFTGFSWGWGGWMASPTRWACVWVNSGSWWRSGGPGVLRSTGSQESDTAEWLNHHHHFWFNI